MTPQQAKQLLDSGVLQAFAEGKPIQYKLKEGQLLESTDRGWRNYVHSDSGWNLTSANADIYEWRVAPEKKTGWINIYPSGSEASSAYTSLYKFKHYADDAAQDNRIACIQITYEEGEGL